MDIRNKNYTCMVLCLLLTASTVSVAKPLMANKPEQSKHSGPEGITNKLWHLKDVINLAYQRAPELKTIEAGIKAKYSRYRQAGKWPNPVLEIQSDNRLEKSGVKNGYQTNDVSISQTVSLTGRFAKKKRIAFSEYQHALENGKWKRLNLEAKVTKLYHEMLITRAKLTLAKTRLSESSVLQNIGRRRNRAGDLSRFQRDRLNIVREKSHQDVLFLGTQYTDARTRLLDFLQLDSSTQFHTLNINYDIVRPSNHVAANVVKSHPRMKMAKLRLVISRQELSLAKSERVGDVTVKLYQGRDEFNNRAETVTGIGISVPLPIWNTRRHSVKGAGANLRGASFEVKAINRNLKSNLASRSRHLRHLILQIEHYRKTVLNPAKRVFYLSKRRFRIGDTGILILVDTINTYFEATNQYLTLVEAALKESIRYRLAVGQLAVSQKLHTK